MSFLNVNGAEGTSRFLLIIKMSLWAPVALHILLNTPDMLGTFYSVPGKIKLAVFMKLC